MRKVLLILFLFAPAIAWAQAPLKLLDASSPAGPVSLQEDDISLEDALHEIARQANLNVAFSVDLVRRVRLSGLNLHGVSAAEAIVQILRGTGLGAFVTPDGSVVIRALPEKRQPPPKTQIVRGTVTDRAARMPLIGANVVVVGSDPLIGTTSDTNGEFVLENVPLGRQDFRVSYVGYEPLVFPEVLVTSGKEVVLAITLKQKVVVGAEVVVMPEIRKEQPLNEMALVSARSFSVEETRRYAGGLDDPARMASAFAGVSTGAGIQENAIIVRGNAPKGVLWRLEGVEIPNPNHFAGLAVMGAGGLTLFSSHLLDNSDFLSGAFPAEYGNALAGVFDMNFRSGNSSAREHALQAGVIGIDLASEGPFSHGHPATYLVNYRYSTIGLLLPLLPTEDAASFQDLSFKLSFPTRGAGRFDVWGIGGLDSQSMAASDDSSSWEYEVWDRIDMDLDLGVGAAGVSHALVIGERSFLKTTAAVSANRTRLDQHRIDDDLVMQDNLRIDNTTGAVTLSSTLNHKLGQRHTNRTGVSMQRLFFDLDLRAAIDDVPPPASVAAEGGGTTLARAFTQSRYDVTPRLSLQAGLHAQYFALTGSRSLEPRLGVRMALGENDFVSAGYGMHSQIEDLRIYFVDDLNRRLETARANHWVMGYERRLGAGSRIRADVYYQYLFDVPVIPDSTYSLINFEQDWQFRDALQGDGAGRNYGVELTLERFLKNGFYYLATASAFESEYRGGDGVWRPTRWDRGYTVNALAGKEFLFGTNLLGVNARVTAMGGKRRSPVDRAASAMHEEVVFDETRAFEEREPGLFLVDVTLTYRRNHRRTSEVWALQVKNALAAKETVLDYNFKTGRVDDVKEGFPLPVLSYKIEF